MRRFCKFCKKQNQSNRDYCDIRCRLLEDTIIETNGCWEWQGLKNRTGYGYFTCREGPIKRKYYHVHRVSYEIFNGKIPNGLHVCHTCDNRKCVKPNHLWVGTNEENHADKISKGRHGHGKCEGTKSYSCKLSDEKVLEIRKLYMNGLTQSELAEIFGVHQTNIGFIVRRKKWKHI